DPLAPAVEVELAVVELDVDPAQAHALTVNAREVRLAADPGPVAAVERVVPDVELPGGRRVDRRDEVDHIVHHVDDIFVRADAVERGYLIAREVGILDLQAPPRVREADDATLLLAPAEHRQVPAWPFLDPRRARVVVFLEPEQTEVAGVRRR